jgi:hypothetical protein
MRPATSRWGRVSRVPAAPLGAVPSSISHVLACRFVLSPARVSCRWVLYVRFQEEEVGGQSEFEVVKGLSAASDARSLTPAAGFRPGRRMGPRARPPKPGGFDEEYADAEPGGGRRVRHARAWTVLSGAGERAGTRLGGWMYRHTSMDHRYPSQAHGSMDDNESGNAAEPGEEEKTTGLRDSLPHGQSCASVRLLVTSRTARDVVVLLCSHGAQFGLSCAARGTRFSIGHAGGGCSSCRKAYDGVPCGP